MRERLPTTIMFSLSKLAQYADLGRLVKEDALSQAHGGLDQMITALGIGKLQSVDGMNGQVLPAVESFGNIWESVLEKLEIFTEITSVLSEVRNATSCLTSQSSTN